MILARFISCLRGKTWISASNRSFQYPHIRFTYEIIYNQWVIRSYFSGKISTHHDPEVIHMKERRINPEIIQRFQKYLEEGEKSDATIEKYIRDIAAFAL